MIRVEELQKLAAIVILGTACCAAHAASDEVTLVADGVAKCRIVVAEDASRPEKFGAQELEKYLLKKGTGIREQGSGDENLIPVRVSVDGGSDAGRAALCRGRDEDGRTDATERVPPEDGFVIDVKPTGIDIIGATPRGALYGCYELLKKYAGMRWLVPGEDGEYCVHEGNTIKVPVGREVQNPYLRIRETRANTVEGFLWHARNNMLSEMNTARFVQNGKRTKDCDMLEDLAVRGVGKTGHIMSDLLIGPYSGKEREAKRDELFAAHPEWFPLIKGARVKILGSLDANPCVSNPALLDHLAENLYEAIKGPHGCESYVTIGNNDTTIWCECEKCKALDAPERKGTPGAMSDRYWFMVGEIAKRVWKKLPEGRFGGWAYQNYWYPPVRTPIDPRLKVFVSYNNMCWRHSVADPKCKVNAEWRRIYRMWEKTKLPFVVDREPVGGDGCVSDYYQPAERVLYENFKAFREYGCGGAHFVLMGAQPDFFKWDNRPPFFGKNLGWYSMWQSCYLSANFMWDITRDFDALYEEANRLYYGAAWEGGFKAFREYLADCFYSVDFCSGWGQGSPLGPVLDRPGSKERLIALLDKAVAAAKASGDDRALRHVLRDKEIFGKTWLYFRDQYEKNYRLLGVKAKSGAITVDGVLDEADWAAAEMIDDFRLSEHQRGDSRFAQTPQRTVVRTVYDPEALYFAVEAMDDDIGNLKEGRNQVEIFYSYPDMAERCFQMIVASDGKWFVWKRNSATAVDKDFKSVAQVAVRRLRDRWVAEVAIPTDEIGSKCLPGQVWKMNVARQRQIGDRNHESSSCCNGIFYGPGNFVNLKFTENK